MLIPAQIITLPSPAIHLMDTPVGVSFTPTPPHPPPPSGIAEMKSVHRILSTHDAFEPTEFAVADVSVSGWVQRRIFLVAGRVPVIGGSSCPSCMLKYVAQVKQVNLPALVAGSATPWTRGGEWDNHVLATSLTHKQTLRNPMACSLSIPESRDIVNVVALT